MPASSPPAQSFRAGYITILGKPNVGKSTLINTLIGQKIAAVSPRPQTTRQRVLGIRTERQAQLLFLDSPGFHQSSRPLNRWMLQQIQQNLHDADIVCLMSAVDIAWDAIDQQLFQLAVETNKPIFLLLNKVDSIAKEKLLPRLKQMSTDCNDLVARPVSAVSDEGLDALIATVRAELPHHPPYYPEDLPTDQSIRFICAEIVREKTMTALWQEIPYAVAVIIEEFKEPRQVNGTTVIKGVIIVEKQSQKPIVIGKGGQQLKGIGCAAREEIENLVGGPVFLSLFVKVSKDWTKNPQKRREYGYG